MLLWLHELGLLGHHRLFTYVTFRMVLGAIVAFLVTVIVTHLLIKYFRKKAMYENHNWDVMQHLEKFEKDGSIPQQKAKPKNVPSMGGIGIVAGILAGILVACDLSSAYVQAAIILLLASCALGFADDYIKRTRPETHGMSEFSKLFIGFLIGLATAAFLYSKLGDIKSFETVWLPFAKNLTLYLGVVYIVFFVLTISVVSNAVNITDGMDGLASGLMAIASITLALVCYIVSRHDYSTYLLIPYVPGIQEVAIIMLALFGACLGFLWHNASPASIYMGDTGSLAIGSLFGFAGLVSKQETVMFIVGAIFFIEFLSSLIQRIVFKVTRTRYFPIAPIHITFDKIGWPANHVVVRAYIVAVFLALLALGSMKIR